MGEARMSRPETMRIWIVRHGMRIDFSDPLWADTADEPGNPPLDPLGLLQVRETVQRFKREDLEAIYVSPFLRTLQTAHLFAEEKGLPLFVEPGFSEYLKIEEFNDNPIKGGTEDFLMSFPSVDPAYNSDSMPVFPEDLQSLDRRIDLVMDRICGSPYRELMIVSHASPIKSIYRYFTGSVPEDYRPTMCSITRFDLQDGRWQPVIRGDTSHLSVADRIGRVFYYTGQKKFPSSGQL